MSLPGITYQEVANAASIKKQKIEYERDLNSMKQGITEVRHQKNQIQRQLDHMEHDLQLKQHPLENYLVKQKIKF